jgi:hypothetical protein
MLFIVRGAELGYAWRLGKKLGGNGPELQRNIVVFWNEISKLRKTKNHSPSKIRTG